MTQLERQQRALLDLIKKRGAPPEDVYLRQVANSRQLTMVREIAVWWRAFQIEDQCHFTSRLLKRLECFENVVTNYFNNHRTSPFIEELSQDFLDSLRDDRNWLIRAVSQFELALLKVRTGSAACFEVLWDRDPNQVILALEQGSELPAPETGYLYRMQIARNLPRIVSCTREYTEVSSILRTGVN
jgi:hypothetical protein